MTTARWRDTVLAGCVMIAAAGCGGSTERTAEDTSGRAAGSTAAATASGQTDDAITVAGCLQKGSGDSFILTRINEPSQSVGTAGASGNTAGGSAGTVEREQLRSAAGAYRVDPSGDVKLEGLVGKEVSVVGRIKENMDLPRANADREPAKISQGDLYEITATTVTTLADVCRGAESPAPATSTSKPGANR